MLKVLAAHMTDVAEQGVFPCRIGGEEFALLFSGKDLLAADAVLEQLRANLAGAKIVFAGSTLPHVTISAGLVSLGSAHDTLETMMKIADEALYQAKDAGRNRTIIVEDDQDAPKTAKAG